MRTQTLLALVAVLALSACADQPRNTSDLTPTQPQQFSAVQWDEAIAASRMAKVNNSGLIMMR